MGLSVVFLLIAVNAFFVAGEFALVAVNRSRVDTKVAEGDPRARRLQGRLRDLSFELSGAQLGITVSSLILGAVAEPTVARLLQPAFAAVGIEAESISVVTALILATAFQMIMGELFPKNVAIARPYPVAIAVGLPMAFVNRMLRPLILLFNSSANWTVRRLGIEPRDELEGLRSLQEFEMIVRASSATGELGDNEVSLLTRAIAFVEKDAADAMVPRVAVVGIASDDTVADLRSLALETGHSRFPVYTGDLDSVFGVAHVKDSFRIPPDERATTSVSEIVTEAGVVPESMRLDSLLIQLQRAGRSMAVVVDEYGGTAGIVTVEDIVEEILGEIEDEHDEDVEPSSSGLVSGGFHRHEVEELTGFQWPEGNYDTLNGFVTARLDRFPLAGDFIEHAGHRIEVVSVDGHVVQDVRISRLDGEGAV